ncbi:MAG: hydantoinase B/oxoprolinase family protein [Wenzhouxiangella sp.]
MPETSTHPGWQFWIDRGGTFTDIVAQTPDGLLRTIKLLSENPECYPDAAIEGIRRLLELGPNEPLPSANLDTVRMGTTVATNALLERTGEPTALLITRGLADALTIGHQARPRLFELHIRRPAALFCRVIEVNERVRADGHVCQAVDLDALRTQLADLRATGIGSLAVVFMHADRFPDHERQVGRLAGEMGFDQISLSHEVSPLIRLIDRGDTTVVDAYLSPVLRRYASRLASALRGVDLKFMKSDGGLTAADRFAGKDAILSGPAGGIVGCVRTAQQAGFDRVIGFDMGGTSTDVSQFNGEYEYSFESTLDGIRLRVPMLRIHTVAAGGGSRLHFDGGRYRVGPDSAGAAPGPACYRRGGPLTITDANLLLGRLQPDHFPRVFGPDGDQPLDRAIVEQRFAELRQTIAAQCDDRRSTEAMAEAYLDIAVHNMAAAIRQITVQKGHDAARYALSCFGGAGGQHACRVADALGIRTVLIHPLSGLLSAYGMGLAQITELREFGLERPLPEAIEALDRGLAEIGKQAMAAVQAQGVSPERIELHRQARLKYAGTDTALTIEAGEAATMQKAFEQAHQREFGFLMPDRPVLVEAGLVEACEQPTELAGRAVLGPTSPTAPLPPVACFFQGRWQPATPVIRRSAMGADDRVTGPALIIDDHATVVVEPGWQARPDRFGNLILSRSNDPAGPVVQASDTKAAVKPDPVRLELFNNLFMSVAEQMGVSLQRTAWSANIKERLDFSCALFDPQGRLVANAPHVPVHLGSMGESVRAIMARHGESMRNGDVYLLNDPYNGGTHLPDLTVVSPCLDGEGRPLYFVANRAHHADVGGLTPGSMPPDSEHIDQEGVLISGELIVRDGQLNEKALTAWFQSARWPGRHVEQNLSDLRAQIAANSRGHQALQAAIDEHGLATVQAYMQHVQDNAAEQVRLAIDELADGQAEKRMDNGALVKLALRVDRSARRLCVDFSGTSPQGADNFNAPAAVTRACVLFALRCLVKQDIPLNDGCLDPVELIIPDGSMLSPRHPAAVVAGNVETSQVIADTLFAAMGALANGPGSMSNLTFGTGQFQHYETLCGGAGAGPGFDGCDAVHVHMTNSRLTDPEILETRFPVVLEQFGIRPDSGGKGRWRGGNGVIRRLRFLEPMSVSLLGNSRQNPPQGQAGGGNALPGQAWLESADGKPQALAGRCRLEVKPNDCLTLETPGGGGWGSASKTQKESAAASDKEKDI